MISCKDRYKQTGVRSYEPKIILAIIQAIRPRNGAKVEISFFNEAERALQAHSEISQDLDTLYTASCAEVAFIAAVLRRAYPGEKKGWESTDVKDVADGS